MNTLKIAIDGPSGAGKSTVARALAQAMNMEYVDTGALYRTLAYIAQREGVEDPKEILQVAEDYTIDFHGGQVYLNGRALGSEIRTEAISQQTSKIAASPLIRQHLLDLQRQLAQKRHTVMEGRDIATVVLPDAQVKIFLTASEEVRGERRYEELKERGENPTLAEVLEDIHQRDLRDKNRAVAPLRPSEESIVVDASRKSVAEIVGEIKGHIPREYLTEDASHAL
ncbi:MAG: (d)CMP kinase [Tissierellia bacterium]|nr:(d)CMP kinase [Tissierellia bacterium]